jgi:hypothetical protein
LCLSPGIKTESAEWFSGVKISPSTIVISDGSEFG